MASLTQWTWVWVNSGSWQWTGRLGVLQSMWLQRVGHDWATELNWTELHFRLFCWLKGYFFSFKEFLPTVELNSSIPVPYSSSIPKLWMFSLAISCLTTSNLPWFVDLTVPVPMQYCSLQHWTLPPLPVTYTTGHCFCFDSASSYFLELYWVPTDLGSSSFNVIFFPFHIFHGVLKARILKWFAIAFSCGPRFARALYHDPSVSGGLCDMAHSFTELDKAVWS